MKIHSPDENAKELEEYKSLEKMQVDGKINILTLVRFIGSDYINVDAYQEAINNYQFQQRNRGLISVQLERVEDISKDVHVAVYQKLEPVVNLDVGTTKR